MAADGDRDSPPGPDGLPVLGHSLQLARDQLAFFERCAQYGDLVPFTAGGRRTYILCHPADIERVLSTEHDRFRKDDFQRRRLGRVVGSGLLTSEGDAWREQRRRIQPAFTPERIASYGEAVVDCTEAVLDGWSAGETVALDEAMQELTLRILVRALFGTDISEHVETIRGAVADIRAWNDMGSLRLLLPEWVPTPQARRGRRALARLDEVIEAIVAERRAAAAWGDDLLSTLVRATEDAEISTDRLRDQLVTFLLAGHETTSLSLTYAWHLLATHPEPAGRFRAELDAVLDGRRPTVEDLPDLAVTERVLDEAMRLYPPVPRLAREARESVRIRGYELPAGTMVLLPQWVVHRDTRWWADPEAFDPTRFADERDANGLATERTGTDRPAYAFFPFGGGPRRCIGDHFSRVEAQLVLATVGQRVTFDRRGEPLPELDVGVTASPSASVTAMVHAR